LFGARLQPSESTSGWEPWLIIAPSGLTDAGLGTPVLNAPLCAGLNAPLHEADSPVFEETEGAVVSARLVGLGLAGVDCNARAPIAGTDPAKRRDAYAWAMLGHRTKVGAQGFLLHPPFRMQPNGSRAVICIFVPHSVLRGSVRSRA